MVRLFGYFCCALFLLITSLSCDSSEPLVNSGAKLTLTVEDSSCTEVWLKLTTTNIPLPVTLSLEQNNTTIDTLSITSADTLLYIDGLLPKQTYKFKAEATNYQLQASNELTTATMDTTSHNFSWQSWEFGELSGNQIYDVNIIDENNIWGTGAFYYNDSLGQPNYYNVITWNGNQWNLQKIMFYTICGQQDKTPYPVKSIWVFNENDIWIGADGDQIARLENGVQTTTICLPWSFTINKIWGKSSEDLYVVGNEGNIAHYQNGVWTKIESGTDVNLRDVCGSPDGSIVWAAGFDDSYGTVFLKNTGSGFEKVLEITSPNIPHPPDEITHVFKSLWTDKTDTVYLGAIGRVYAAPINTTGYAKENIWWDYANQTEYPPETNIIRGTAGNDIFVGGYLQFIQHWNGASWKRYEEIEGDGTWYSMSVKDNLIIAVGENFSTPGGAGIARGYRIK